MIFLFFESDLSTVSRLFRCSSTDLEKTKTLSRYTSANSALIVESITSIAGRNVLGAIYLQKSILKVCTVDGLTKRSSGPCLCHRFRFTNIHNWRLKVEIIHALPSEPNYLSVPRIGQVFLKITAFNFLVWIQNRSEPYFSGANMVSDVNSDCAVSMKVVQDNLSISAFSNFRAFGPAVYRADLKDYTSGAVR